MTAKQQLKCVIESKYVMLHLRKPVFLKYAASFEVYTMSFAHILLCSKDCANVFICSNPPNVKVRRKF